MKPQKGSPVSMSENEKEIREKELEPEEKNAEVPPILEEIVIEELAGFTIKTPFKGKAHVVFVHSQGSTASHLQSVL